VFAGSAAEYGGNLPDVVPDTFYLNPQNSYGIQKACREMLVKDYSRKGFIDGRVPRLQTIIVRPGKPNRAASSFASSIIREPLTGHEAVCPVTADAGIYVLSPRRVIDNFIHAAEIPGERLGMDRAFMLPGLRTSVRELVDALERNAGRTYVDRIRWEKDDRIQTIVSGWPPEFESRQAKELGFVADGSVDEIITQFIEDELPEGAVS
jgi:nucleoside-diphosphate-sugar epimerase